MWCDGKIWRGDDSTELCHQGSTAEPFMTWKPEKFLPVMPPMSGWVGNIAGQFGLVVPFFFSLLEVVVSQLFVAFVLLCLSVC